MQYNTKMLDDMINILGDGFVISGGKDIIFAPHLIKEAIENRLHIRMADDLQAVPVAVAVQAQIGNAVRKDDAGVQIVLEIRHKLAVQQFYGKILVFLNEVAQIGDEPQPLCGAQRYLQIVEIQLAGNDKFRENGLGKDELDRQLGKALPG